MEFGFHTNPHLSIGPDPLERNILHTAQSSCPSAIGVQIKPQKKKKKEKKKYYWAENKIIGITQYSDKEEEEEEEEEGDSTERKKKTSQLNQRQREIIF